MERLKFQAASLKLKSSNARKIAFGRPKMTKYEKISLAISIALLILSYGFAGAQPRLAKTAASLAVFRLSAVAPYLLLKNVKE